MPECSGYYFAMLDTVSFNPLMAKSKTCKHILVGIKFYQAHCGSEESKIACNQMLAIHLQDSIKLVHVRPYL